MNFDDLDKNPPRAPSRNPKFAPKSSKAALKLPKPEQPPGPKVEAPAPKAEPLAISAAPPDETETKPPAVVGASSSAKTESSNSNGAVAMEIDQKLDGGKAEPMEEEDGGAGDEVVREIDVFFNPSIDARTQLYLVQYPLRPCWRPYELDERCEEVRVKPLSAEVEVDLCMDVDSKNYDRDCNSQLKMTKQTLSSSWKPPCATSYAVGILTGNKLHLNPIHAMVQLRPSMEHLYPEGSNMKNTTSGNPGGSLKKDGGEEKAGPSKKQGKLSEHLTKQETDEEEDWVPLAYHDSKSDLSARYVQNMAAQQCSPIHFAISPYDYVNSLCPGGGTQKSQLEGSSRRVLLKLPFEERIKKLLCEAPYAHRYSALRYYAQDVSDDVFSTVLEDNAVLVQGCWVAKTSLLHFDNKKHEPLARDYTLLLFSKEPLIRKTVLPLRRAISDPMKKFLNMFAVERPKLNDWKFKQETDMPFLKNHPDIVKRQSGLWEAREKNIMVFFNDKGGNMRDGNNTNHAAVRQSSVTTKDAKALKSDRTAVKAAGRTTMSPETREALPRALQKVFHNQKVCSFQIICERLRGLAVSQSTLPKADARMAINAAKAVESREELIEVLNQLAVDIHGFYVLKSSPEHPELDELRRVLIDLLIGKGPKATLKRAEIVEAARMKLKREFPKNELDKVITDLCESRGSLWVLRSGN